MLVNGKNYRTVWLENGIVKLINQPLLPDKFEIYTWRQRGLDTFSELRASI